MTNTCSFDECELEVLAKDLCARHYKQYRKQFLPACSIEGCKAEVRNLTHQLCATHNAQRRARQDGVTCTHPDGCNRPQASKALCSKHYRRLTDSKKPICTVDDCERVQRTSGLCSAHYNLSRRESGSPCSVEGCVRPLYALDVCNMHYQRLKSSGDLGPAENIRLDGLTISERFSFYVLKGDQCWEWQGRRSNGYGEFDLSGGPVKKILAHRMSFAIAHGMAPSDLPTGLHVHHKCANRGCVRPDHLVLSTARENVAEMFARKSYVSAIRMAIGVIESYNPLDRNLAVLRKTIETEEE